MAGTSFRIFPDFAKDGGFGATETQAKSYDLRLVSVDPGGEHVGVAVFGKNTRRGGWECLSAIEMTPIQFEDWLSEHMALSTLDILVVEEWKLFGSKALAQTGSAMETPQLIGVIKYIHRMCKGTKGRWPRPDVELHFQPPTIKVATKSVLKNRGLQSMAKRLKSGGHALDAELHGYHHIIHTRGESAGPLD